MIKYIISLCCIFTILFNYGFGINLNQDIQKPEEVFFEYLDALLKKKWNKAESFWLNHDIEISQRLGIKYLGVSVKHDLDSPLFLNLSKIKSKKDVRIIRTMPIDSYLRLDYKILSHSEKDVYFYFLKKQEKKWNEIFIRYKKLYPKEAKEITSCGKTKCRRYLKSS